MRKIAAFMITTFICVCTNAQVTTNGGSGLNVSYPDLHGAINALNGASITSPVIITVTGNIDLTGVAALPAITASGSSTNTITIQGVGSTITSSSTLAAGSLTDAVFKVVGGDYITIQNFTLQENAANTTTSAGTNNMTEWGVAFLYATTSDGAQNNTVKNCTVTLNRTYQNTFGIYSNVAHSSTSISSADIISASGDNSNLILHGNNISNVNIGIAVVGVPAFMGTGLNIGGSSLATANTISDFGTTGTFSSYSRVSGTVNGILVTNQSGANVSYNSITSSNGGTTAGTLRGIFFATSGTLTYPASANTSTISNNTISLKTAVASGTSEGIRNDIGENVYTSLVITNNDFNNFTNTAGSPSGAITFIVNSAPVLNQTFSSNTFTALSLNTTGTIMLISNASTGILPATGTQTANSNSIVTSFTRTAAGTTTLMSDPALHVSGAVVNWTNNSFSNLALVGSGATVFTGFSNTSGATSATVTKTFSGNTLSNITGTVNFIIGMSATKGSLTTPVTISGNTFSNLSSGSTTAISCGLGIVSVDITSNIINNLTATAAGISGIVAQPSGVANISQNVVNTLSSSGTSTVIGFSVQGATLNIFRNKIYDLQTTNTTAIVTGINFLTGTTVAIYNNLIADLRAPNSTALDGIRGISTGNSTGTFTVTHNTIYLNASSTSVSTFGTSCITFGTNSAAGTLNARNNILVNLSTPAQEGSNLAANGIAAGIRRVALTVSPGSVPVNYATTSNNNLIYVNPGAGTNNHLTYVEGITATVYSPQNTLAQMKLFMQNRDQGSTDKNISFISTSGSSSDFLKPSSGNDLIGIGGTGIANDFANNTRLTIPAIGAHEVSVPGIWSAAAASNVWSTGSNWQDANAPASGVSIYIPSVSSNMPELSANASMGRLLNNGTLTITATNTLQLSGDVVNGGTIAGSGTVSLNGSNLQVLSGTGTYANLLLNNAAGSTVSGGTNNKVNMTGVLTPTLGMFTTNGNVVLKSTSIANTALVGVVGGIISGNVQVERFIPQSNRAFRFLAPGVTGSTIKDAWQEGATANTANPNPGYGTHITGSTVDQTNGFDGTVNGNPSMFTFNSGTQMWEAITSTTSTFSDAKTGYRILIRGDRTYTNISTTSAASMNAATTLRATGALATGNQSFTLAANNAEYTMLGNPYWAPVSWTAVSKTNLNSNFWIWNPTLAGSNNRGAYVSASSGDIQPGQAFFVLNSAAGATLSFDEANKNVGGTLTNTFRNSVAYDGRIIAKLYLQQNFAAGLMADEAKTEYSSSFTTTIDKDDAPKLGNPDENLSFRVNNTNLSINATQLPKYNDTLWINLGNMLSKNYVLEIECKDFVNTLFEAYLVDSYTQTKKKLDINGSIHVNYSLDQNTASSVANRFYILYKSVQPILPVQTQELNVTVSPNPASSYTLVNYAAKERGKAVINIINSNGQVVQNINLGNQQNGQYRILLSKLSAGMYTIEFVVGKERSTNQLIKL